MIIETVDGDIALSHCEENPSSNRFTEAVGKVIVTDTVNSKDIMYVCKLNIEYGVIKKSNKRNRVW